MSSGNRGVRFVVQTAVRAVAIGNAAADREKGARKEELARWSGRLQKTDAIKLLHL
jgi:hypothetical protein